MDHVLHGLAQNPSLPAALVERLIGIADGDLAVSLAARADLSGAQAAALAGRDEGAAVRLAYEGRLTDVDPETQPRAALALLDQGAGLPQWARRFASDPDPEVREKVAACPGLPPEIVARLAADPDVQVVAELALWAAADTAADLAQHPHTDVRRAVAVNEAAPPAVLAMLLTGDGLAPAERCRVCDQGGQPPWPGAVCDGSHRSAVHGIRQAALRNPATPVEAAVRFAGDPSVRLRMALAAHAGLPAHICERLAADPDPAVRAGLAANPAIGDALIRAMAADPDHDVRRGLARHPRVPLDVLTGLAAVTRMGRGLLPRVAAASPAEVAHLAAAPDPVARRLVAARRDLPEGIRDALAADPDANVAACVAPHPGLSEARLRAMVTRHAVQVIAQVAANPEASPVLLADLARRRPPVRKALRVIAGHPQATAPALLACLADPKARPVAAGHPALPPPVVAGLLTDGDWQVAEAAAANASLPPAVMARLMPGPFREPAP
ncbi:hypothetical protein [Actinacidiphila acididurans]|uniref:Leucine rich repeat variant n=1 Tax=Actinacidiphila acididurans TaxID=2784346 RepID=A0ABS2TW62_9ACTN|nr:hypothetical protein [Actinacidiphila acididurans]MBM9506525.1 hypothetical protein [Actinacidiphila acididurans]